MKYTGVIVTCLSLGLALATGIAVEAAIPGIQGTTFNLVSGEGYISTGDGLQLLIWGYGAVGDPSQYPGPTLIVQEGAVITVNLTNDLNQSTSIVFPGQMGVIATGGTPGVMTREAAPGGTVSYQFTATRPGTYMYHSGTEPDLQVELGLVGALIVRPAAGPGLAYNHPDSAYDREYLFLLTEMDVDVHQKAALGLWNQIDLNEYWPVYWFINGRNAPDTMASAYAQWLPHQPYNSMVRMHPGEKVLLRLIGAGREPHPFHTHGNHVRVIAKDGVLQRSAGAAGIDLAELHFTCTVYPGGTADGLFEWTGAQLGWDIYGHQHDLDLDPVGDFPGPEDIDHNGNGLMDVVPLEPEEDPAEHGRPFPVLLPDAKDLAFGATYSGSPYLGTFGYLPPGQGGFNLNAGYFYMWHSHSEKEMTNYDIFPGGLMTMLIVEPPDVYIP
ncbi:multicopper oxidase family protein [bacterium]|nr:multicopper oxidase family protein [candidate division CSSED10-310 bacterium]